MSLDTLKSPHRRPSDLPSDKPQVDHVEHGNLERPGAMVHPRASRRWRESSPATAWERYTQPIDWR